MVNRRQFPKLNKAGKDARDALHARLAQAHPKTFVAHDERRGNMRPLKIGVFEDLVARYPEVPEETVHAFTIRYANSKWYLRATMVVGAARLDLDGNAVGQITEEQAASAGERLERKIGRQAKYRAKQAVAVDAAPTASVDGV